MNKLKLKIFPKTFIGALSLVVGIILIAFILISVLMPRFYRVYKEESLNKDLTNLMYSLENKNISEITRLLERFALTNEYGISLIDEQGDTLFSRQIGMMVQNIDTMPGENTNSGESITFNIDSIQSEQTLTDAEGRLFTLKIYSSVQPIDEANTVLFQMLPYVLLISLVLGVVVSFIYTKTITAPVKAISRATFNMRTLEKDVKCDVKSSDEIGELAVNINQLYGRLLTTINDLQTEIQNVAASDKEKIDFMLTVSHELKTPLTSVKGMVEGMIHNVGVYKDRDEYLIRCGETIDALTALVNEILDASKLELSSSPEDYSDINICEFIKNIAATYEMIALSKQVNIDINVVEDMSRSLPVNLFSKALSNIISNAVKYADTGGEVSIYTDSDRLVIENTCNPLSPEEICRTFEPFQSGGENGGHGLGLYLTERILKVCGLQFEFIPFDNGMQFIIFMK
ncbi:MAG: HAMP domain-containing histidine kinase [Oscillospiraceae bacterium]|jgi:signal transduction histidine kinase|nr:HAMP domain-containing histidine kinase [Oscillospiraceae bacterium]